MIPNTPSGIIFRQRCEACENPRWVAVSHDHHVTRTEVVMMPLSVEGYEQKRAGILSERGAYEAEAKRLEAELFDAKKGVERCDTRLAELDAAQKEAASVP